MVQEQIAKLFNLSADNSEVIEQLASLCRVYDLKPKDLKFKWEAFSFSLKRQHMAPTVELIRQLQSNLQRELDQKQRKSANVRATVKMDLSDYTSHMDDVSQTDALEDFMSKLTGDVAAKSTSVSTQRISTDAPMDLQASQASAQFTNRKATHVLEEQYNVHLASRGPVTKGQKRASVNLVQEPAKDFYYMFEKIKERGDVQNELLEYMSEKIEKYYGISELVTNPARPYQSKIYTVGRIAWDETDASKLNDKSAVLEASRELGMGKRVKLDLSKVQEYALFPGQVVGIKGVNNTGKQLTVEEILLPPLPPSIVQKPEDLYEHSYGEKVQGQPLEIILAAGPYTLDEDLTFKPLDELISMCLSEKPDVLVLLGPFVSESHPIIANGSVSLLPEEVFQAQVSRRLQQLSSACPETTILVMPHPEDAAQEYTMFPQPSMRTDTLGLGGVQTLSNPAMVNINGVVFAISSSDILLRLGREECAKTAGQADRFSRLANYLLQQHSFYPLFPPAVDDCIDSARITDLQIPVTPDVLVLPSQLKHFVKCVDQVLCVNPGRLSRRQTGGTYSKFTIHPLPKQADGALGAENKVSERTRVEIIKL